MYIHQHNLAVGGMALRSGSNICENKKEFKKKKKTTQMARYGSAL